MTLSALKTSLKAASSPAAAAIVLGALLAAASAQTRPTTNANAALRATEAQLDSQRAWYKSRVQQDRRRYSRESVSDADGAYDALAAKGWRGQEAAEQLQDMMRRFPELNRTGCAVLNYALSAEADDEREKYLRLAVEAHSDCFYPDGAQVGGLARYHLGHLYRARGKSGEADELFNEIRASYPDALTHGGERLVAVLDAEGAAGQQTVPATLPAE